MPTLVPVGNTCWYSPHSLQWRTVHEWYRESQYTILYSHGNAEDLGLILPDIDWLAQETGRNVLAYVGHHNDHRQRTTSPANLASKRAVTPQSTNITTIIGSIIVAANRDPLPHHTHVRVCARTRTLPHTPGMTTSGTALAGFERGGLHQRQAAFDP